MTTIRKIVVRIVFIFCVIVILLRDYTGLVGILLGGDRAQPNSSQHRLPPKPSNPGYGDSKTEIDLDADIEEETINNIGPSPSTRSQILQTIKTACLPKLICELNATPRKDKLTESERALLTLIRDTSVSTTAELTSKYHFAAHMGQLISGVDGNGCHNFYPTCPFPGLKVLQMIKKVRMR
ncbi:uncharacterized protein LOC108740921 [Agrilus planipennis]|uniref:Uncharacterized protein LOC108740921 n=1 Tax=Agrilus planipennis TaxID=224129 RepID=A0A1W4X4C6_AGRPL|nr:uncharacterized protein LOC108740921 [Agrilus planipennis]